jgi:hypothetical protein
VHLVGFNCNSGKAATENIVRMPGLLSGQDFCEHGKESSGSRQDWILRDHVSDCQLLKKASVSCFENDMSFTAVRNVSCYGQQSLYVVEHTAETKLVVRVCKLQC